MKVALLMDKLITPLAAALLLTLFVWVSNDDYKQGYKTMPEAIEALEQGRLLAK
jgi:hypothetical protein